MSIFRLKMHIFRLDFYIFSLKIEYYPACDELFHIEFEVFCLFFSYIDLDCSGVEVQQYIKCFLMSTGRIYAVIST